VACLVEEGYARTTTTAIQDRAGVSRGALTHQFRSKNELLTAAIAHLAHIRRSELVAAAVASEAGDRIDAGLRLLWQTFNTDLFQAAVELWVASRTDDDLYAVLIESERAIARAYSGNAVAIFGPVAEAKGFAAALDSVVIHMRGAAITDILRRSSRTGQTIAECRAIVDAAVGGS